MGKVIDLDLYSIFDGINQLKRLKEKVRNTGVDIPEIQGCGDTAQTIHNAAESFRQLETTWEQLLDESINFFEKVEKSHRTLQEQLAQGMKSNE